jgi:hypothetical protein
MTKNLEQLKEERKKLNIQIEKIEKKELIEKTIPELKKYVGNCYKYINSYYGEKQLWPLYKKIISFNEQTMSFNVLRFQHTSRNDIEINYNIIFEDI